MTGVFELPEYAAAIAEMICQQQRDRTDEREAEYRAAVERWRALGLKCAQLFGQSRGWTVARKSFFEGRLPQPYTDHTWYFSSEKDELAAIGAHLFDFERVAENARAWAAEHGLRFEELGTAGSWHYPAKTTLVVYATSDDWPWRLQMYLSDRGRQRVRARLEAFNLYLRFIEGADPEEEDFRRDALSDKEMPNPRSWKQLDEYLGFCDPRAKAGAKRLWQRYQAWRQIARLNLSHALR